MKKLKLLPTILMLVLCVGVLAIGIYAVTPTKNTISGSITINASNPEVLISAYTYTGGTISSTPYMQPTSARSGVTIPLPNNALTIDTSTANTVEDLKALDTQIAIRIQNPSSDSLGAYFSTTPMTTNAGDADVKKVVPLVNNVLQASLSGYTEVAGNNATADMLMTFNVLDFVSSSTTVTLGDTTDQFTDIYLNIETYNPELTKPAVTLNTSLSSVTVTAKTVNTLNPVTTAEPLTTTTTFKPELKLDDATYKFANYVGSYGYDNYYDEEADEDVCLYEEVDFVTNPAYQAEPMQIIFTVTNPSTNTKPVRAYITGTTDYEGYTISIVNNEYIPAGDSGEVTVNITYNISSLYSRGYLTTLPEALKGLYYTVTVEEWTDDEVSANESVQNRIYEEDGKYYIEYGKNPYYDGTTTHKENLRWYIWAKDDGSGNKVALEDTNPMEDSGTYYFISEYALDGPVSSGSNTGISFQNGCDYINGINKYGSTANYYAESNVRDYLTGKSARNSYISIYDCDGYYFAYYFSAGTSVNFYERFGLTEDSLYSQIQGVSMTDLYKDILAEGISTDLGDYASQEDKFWLLSKTEAETTQNNGLGIFDAASRKAYKLSAGTKNTAIHWWLRSPSVTDSNHEYYVDSSGKISSTSVNHISPAVRPAFKIVI